MASTSSLPFRILVGWSLLWLMPRMGAAEPSVVDFRYAPSKWQTSICLPDDACKTLVDERGGLLYYYGRGEREFGVRVSAVVDTQAEWVGQDLVAPRVPIVQTVWRTDHLDIVEEAFAVTAPLGESREGLVLHRRDGLAMIYGWAQPGSGIDAAMGDIAVHTDGPIHFQIEVSEGDAYRVALALCEGWHDQTGQRVQRLRVEGATTQTVDTVAKLGKNQAGIFWFDGRDSNHDGLIDVHVEAIEDGRDQTTILNGLWVFDAKERLDDLALLAGKADLQPLATMASIQRGRLPRNDLLMVTVTNTDGTSHTIHPRIVVDSSMPLDARLTDQRLVVNRHETITSSLEMTAIEASGESVRHVQLKALTVGPGQSESFLVLYSGGDRVVIDPATLEQARAHRQAAVEYWNSASLPWGRLEVPDRRIQALIDSSIRNIWQAREIMHGLPSFQVGPTCYRNLWIVDGAFLLETATMLGSGAEARNGIRHTLKQQEPSGAFEVLSPEYYKENGIVLWTCARHAMLTQDKAWLHSVWKPLTGAVATIQRLRARTLENDKSLDDSLMPPGEIDGGLSGATLGFQYPEYTNVYWNLLGLKAIIEAAHWLGKDEQAVTWQEEFDSFFAAFEAAAKRDLRPDVRGNHYLPILMGRHREELPQKAQWAFCHAVYPGQLFPRNDPLVNGNLAMLRATEQQGMVVSTGWMTDGIWTYFASFYGHAWLWQGDGRKAAECLYAMANHASPLLAWREEQPLCNAPYRQVGDMPHNWASAEFLRLALHLVALDRGKQLHLFEGLPVQWTRPGMVTRLQGVATVFGPLTLSLKISQDGKTAVLSLDPLSDPACEKIVVHVRGKSFGTGSVRQELDPGQPHLLTLDLEGLDSK